MTRGRSGRRSVLALGVRAVAAVAVRAGPGLTILILVGILIGVLLLRRLLVPLILRRQLVVLRLGKTVVVFITVHRLVGDRRQIRLRAHARDEGPAAAVLAAVLLRHLLRLGSEQAVIVLRMLVVVFCGHPVALGRRIAGERQVTLEHLVRVAPDLHLGPVRLEGLVARVSPAAPATAAMAPLLVAAALTLGIRAWSHGLIVSQQLERKVSDLR